MPLTAVHWHELRSRTSLVGRRNGQPRQCRSGSFISSHPANYLKRSYLDQRLCAKTFFAPPTCDESADIPGSLQVPLLLDSSHLRPSCFSMHPSVNGAGWHYADINEKGTVRRHREIR